MSTIPKHIPAEGYIPPSRQREKPQKEYKYLGKNMKRVEDPRLLTGQGGYIDDIKLPGMAYAAVLRSDRAHARIKRIDTAKAKALPGVLLVMTGEEAKKVTGPTAQFAAPPVVQYCIAVDRVRHVGEAVAAVVAETRYIAEDACDLIEVEYEDLPVVIDPIASMKATGDAVLHPDRGPTNIAHQTTFKFGEVDQDFAKADKIVKRHLRWPRSGGQPLETVGAVAQYHSGTGKFTIHCNSSFVNYVGFVIAGSLGVPAHKLNIIPVTTGGSYGSKLFTHKVITLAATLARACGRPVKWLEDRLDNTLSCDNHGSDRIYDCELAVKNDGTMLSLRFTVIDDYGAYLQFGYGTHGNSLCQVVGPYQIGSVQMELIAVLTNKCQQGAYRGFGSEVTNWMVERMVDAAVEELKMDPIEFRRKNLIKPEQFPYVIPTGNIYDSGNYPAVLDEALRLADLKKWKDIQAKARAEGRHVGIGIACCQERSVFSSTEFWSLNPVDAPNFTLTSSPESTHIRVDPTGNIQVTLGSPFWGNSPETVATQVVAEQFQCDPANVNIVYSDTQSGFNSTGPGGSRYTVMIAGAIVGASMKIKEKMLRIAGKMLEAKPEDLEFRDGKVGVKGVPGMEKTIGEIAIFSHMFRLSLPDGDEYASGLDAGYVYDHPLTTMPAADRSHLGIFYPIMGHMCHLALVEVDAKIGKVKILDYVAVHDAGTLVNPMTLAGHIRGGTAQGIGSTLYEHFYYDESGQLLTATFTDYLIPTLHEMPNEIRVGHVQTPSPFTEYGIKGGGEGGRMGAPPALSGAVEDALRPYGIKIDELPLTPKRIRTMVRAAEARKP
jgi:CO/xanthine dehydrogenase Mo-binding subunit